MCRLLEFMLLVIFLGLLFLFTPWLYRPYLDLLGDETLERPTAATSGEDAVERLERRVQAKWTEARQAIEETAASQRASLFRAQAKIDGASETVSQQAQAEEAALEATVATRRMAHRR